MATPGSHGVLAVPGFEQFPTNSPTTDNFVSRGLIELANSDGGRPPEYFHDLSPYSESVLADVTNGALRQDLSLFLEHQDINWLEGWDWPGGKNSPFGGIKDSGLGIEEGVIEAMRFMSHVKTFSLPW